MQIKLSPAFERKENMKKLALLAAAALCFTQVCLVQGSVKRDKGSFTFPTTFAFMNVNVIPMDTERVLANQTVIVKNGTIEQIGPSEKIRIPGGAQRIDGTGKYLM